MTDLEPKYEWRSMIEFERKYDELFEMMRITGDAIIAVYKTDFAVETKDDNSPLTQADRDSHNIMVPTLESLFDLPVISEEDNDDQQMRTQAILQNEHAFIVVDPLDGTREFKARSGQFCPGFAVIEAGRPVFGMYSVPTQNTIYYGGASMGSYRKVGDEQPVRIHVATEGTNIVLASRIDKGGPTADYVQKYYGGYKIALIGSMMKFGLLAEGSADAYPCIDRPLKLWDVAPGQAIVEGAGGVVTRPDGSPINYGNQTLLAGDFVARAF